MKLELKHIAPYLPYGLKGRVDKESYLQEERERIGELKTIDLADHNYELAVYGDLGYFLCDISDFKPILRPLSDLTKEIEVNGEIVIPIDYISTSKADKQQMLNRIENNQSIDVFEYWKIEKLLSLHFDVFGLIEQGLAIDIDDLQHFQSC